MNHIIECCTVRTVHGELSQEAQALVLNVYQCTMGEGAGTKNLATGLTILAFI